MKAGAPFLFEIGCEEIPAGMIPGASHELKVILERYLEAERVLDGATLEVFASPRRLVVTCIGLRLKQEDVEKEVTGPPKAVAFDAAGKPTRAAESFAVKQGVPVASLYAKSTPRGECVAARQVVKGRVSAELLGEILPKVIREIPWPKTMYWTEASGTRFIRPIRWIVAMLGNRAIRFELGWCGQGIRRQDTASWGRLRFWWPVRRITSRSCGAISCWCSRKSGARRLSGRWASWRPVEGCK